MRWTLLLFLVSCSTETPLVKNEGAKYCREDVATFCAGISPGEGRISDCLRANRNKVSLDCRNHLNFFDKEFDNAFMATMNICKEHDVLCGHVKRYGARRINCLKQVYLETPEKLSPECRESFSRIIDRVPPVSR